MKRRTAQWVRKAEEDHVAASKLSRSRTPLHNSVCFHCQQCAEKYFKGLLEEQGRTVPKTHDLEHLFDLVLPHYPSVRPLKRGLLSLTSYAVETRYLEKNASRRDAESALVRTERVRTAVRALLGIQPRKKRKKSR